MKSKSGLPSRSSIGTKNNSSPAQSNKSIKNINNRNSLGSNSSKGQQSIRLPKKETALSSEQIILGMKGVTLLPSKKTSVQARPNDIRVGGELPDIYMDWCYKIDTNEIFTEDIQWTLEGKRGRRKLHLDKRVHKYWLLKAQHLYKDFTIPVKKQQEPIFASKKSSKAPLSPSNSPWHQDQSARISDMMANKKQSDRISEREENDMEDNDYTFQRGFTKDMQLPQRLIQDESISLDYDDLSKTDTFSPDKEESTFYRKRLSSPTQLKRKIVLRFPTQEEEDYENQQAQVGGGGDYMRINDQKEKKKRKKSKKMSKSPPATEKVDKKKQAKERAAPNINIAVSPFQASRNDDIKVKQSEEPPKQQKPLIVLVKKPVQPIIHKTPIQTKSQLPPMQSQPTQAKKVVIASPPKKKEVEAEPQKQVQEMKKSESKLKMNSSHKSFNHTQILPQNKRNEDKNLVMVLQNLEPPWMGVGGYKRESALSSTMTKEFTIHRNSNEFLLKPFDGQKGSELAAPLPSMRARPQKQSESKQKQITPRAKQNSKQNMGRLESQSSNIITEEDSSVNFLQQKQQSNPAFARQKTKKEESFREGSKDFLIDSQQPKLARQRTLGKSRKSIDDQADQRQDELQAKHYHTLESMSSQSRIPVIQQIYAQKEGKRSGLGRGDSSLQNTKTKLMDVKKDLPMQYLSRQKTQIETKQDKLKNTGSHAVLPSGTANMDLLSLNSSMVGTQQIMQSTLKRHNPRQTDEDDEDYFSEDDDTLSLSSKQRLSNAKGQSHPMLKDERQSSTLTLKLKRKLSQLQRLNTYDEKAQNKAKLLSKETGNHLKIDDSFEGNLSIELRKVNSKNTFNATAMESHYYKHKQTGDLSGRRRKTRQGSQSPKSAVGDNLWMYKIKPFKVIAGPQIGQIKLNSMKKQQSHNEIMLMAEDLLLNRDACSQNDSGSNKGGEGSRSRNNYAKSSTQKQKMAKKSSKKKRAAGSTSSNNNSANPKYQGLSISPRSQELSPNDSVPTIDSPEFEQTESRKFTFSLEFQKKIYSPAKEAGVFFKSGISVFPKTQPKQKKHHQKSNSQSPVVQGRGNQYLSTGGDQASGKEQQYTISASLVTSENIHVGAFNLTAQLYRKKKIRNPGDLGVTTELDEEHNYDVQHPINYTNKKFKNSSILDFNHEDLKSGLVNPTQFKSSGILEQPIGRSNKKPGKKTDTLLYTKNLEKIKEHYQHKQKMRISIDNVVMHQIQQQNSSSGNRTPSNRQKFITDTIQTASLMSSIEAPQSVINLKNGSSFQEKLIGLQQTQLLPNIKEVNSQTILTDLMVLNGTVRQKKGAAIPRPQKASQVHIANRNTVLLPQLNLGATSNSKFKVNKKLPQSTEFPAHNSQQPHGARNLSNSQKHQSLHNSISNYV